MKKQRQKKGKKRTQANMDGELSVTNGRDANHPFHQDNTSGDSVAEHKKQEAANKVLAEKEIEQVHRNS